MDSTDETMGAGHRVRQAHPSANVDPPQQPHHQGSLSSRRSGLRDLMAEAEDELGMEPGELEGTFDALTLRAIRRSSGY